MSKWLPEIAFVLMVIILGGAAIFYNGKAVKVSEDNKSLTKQVKAEQAKTQAIVEEYNALKKIQDDGDRNKELSQEKTDAAKASHVKSGVPVYASKHDVGLLRQRSLEVRGETTGDTSKANQ